jgi:hypothetical protein
MIEIKIDPASKRLLDAEISRYVAKKNSDGEKAIMELGAHVAKGLAGKVQPWGLSVGKMKKYMLSIEKQANRAVKNANVMGDAGTASAAHESRRGRRGQVSKNLQTTGQYKQKPISIADRTAQAKKKAAVAGTAKGAWLHCAVKCFSAIRIPAFFRKFLKNGTMSKTGNGLNTAITITNHLDYIQNAMSGDEIKSGIATGYRAMIGKIKKIIEK